MCAGRCGGRCRRCCTWGTDAGRCGAHAPQQTSTGHEPTNTCAVHATHAPGQNSVRPCCGPLIFPRGVSFGLRRGNCLAVERVGNPTHTTPGARPRAQSALCERGREVDGRRLAIGSVRNPTMKTLGAHLASAGVKLMVDASGCRSSTPVEVRQPPKRALRLSASTLAATGKRSTPARAAAWHIRAHAPRRGQAQRARGERRGSPCGTPASAYRRVSQA